MVKIVFMLIISLTISNASESFEKACLKCHVKTSVPNEVIYKRYLLKYSSRSKIREAMVAYLKRPTTKKTIMPPRFISIFGLKERMKLSDEMLNIYVNKLIDNYDVKNKFYLKEQ